MENVADSSCTVCKKKFKSPEKLSLHMRFHSLFGNFKKASISPENSMEEGMDGNGKLLLFARYPTDGLYFI